MKTIQIIMTHTALEMPSSGRVFVWGGGGICAPVWSYHHMYRVLQAYMEFRSVSLGTHVAWAMLSQVLLDQQLHAVIPPPPECNDTVLDHA